MAEAVTGAAVTGAAVTCAAVGVRCMPASRVAVRAPQEVVFEYYNFCKTAVIIFTDILGVHLHTKTLIRKLDLAKKILLYN